MGLEVYRKKRKFDVTPEPRGREARSAGNRFVIQKHAARRLHYDLRLELDGVMKSWAVTRGPSLVPSEKRLAVHVEDHPIEYNEFEGTIPEGEYGGGTVLIWDRGRWIPEGDPHKGLEKGHLEFALDGEKLRGRWHLIRIRGRPNERRENWLLVKGHDETAREAAAPDILDEQPLSVASGRSIDEIAAGKGKTRVWHSNRSVQENVEAGAARGAKRPAARKSDGKPSARPGKAAAGKKPAKKARTRSQGTTALPDFIPPSLATMRTMAPTGPGWVHEIKFDGYRMQARLDHGAVKLLTRKGLDWAEKFPNVARAVKELPAGTALLDGEVVVENGGGISDFSMLQAALREGESERFVYYVFDLLHRDGHDLMQAPLRERKAELKDLLGGGEPDGPLRYSDHVEEEGKLVLQQACRMSLEGIVSKLADAPYRPGRSESFIKAKCHDAQEFVVGGFAPSAVTPKAIGALLAGYYDGGRLIYAGRVGTGYTQAVARDLYKRLHPLERSKRPFDQWPADERRRDARWVEPKVVIEAHFRGWTADGIVRQAAFKGLREDKPAAEVTREVPIGGNGHADGADPEPATRSHARAATAKVAGRATPGPRGKPATAPPTQAIRFTHPDRVYWADVGITKQDLADFYRSVWDRMAPHLVDRPLSFLRCPDGTAGQCFFQKHASAGLDDTHLRTVIDAKKRQVIAVQDLDGLLSLVQAGVLEVHVRGSTIERLDRCERIVFDLDPGEGVAWKDIVRAARDVRERLAALDLVSFVKLSGGKGLHVVLPVAGTDWDTTKAFAQAVAQAMAADDPSRYVATMTKSQRAGKIFVDYFRNSLEQTSIAVYSTRARLGAPVSVPVTWQELGRTTGGNQFTVQNLPKRLAKLKRDPWADMEKVRQKLPR